MWHLKHPAPLPTLPHQISANRTGRRGTRHGTVRAPRLHSDGAPRGDGGTARKPRRRETLQRRGLQAEYGKQHNRLDGMYVDTWDGRMEAGFYDRKVAEWQTE